MRRLALAAVALAVCGCTRTIRIDSLPQAKILDGAAVACPTTPCDWSFSRETCWGYDSSRGYFRLIAMAEDGRELSSPMLKTCAVRRGTRLSFRFDGPAGCAVTVTDRRGEKSFACSELPPAKVVRPR
ncbi:MAG: hypothetical protein HY553_08500 [Elusimicrobia bacterium]|nr:hypothetical protein [Elusimicrobiota bacterium]